MTEEIELALIMTYRRKSKIMLKFQQERIYRIQQRPNCL